MKFKAASLLFMLVLATSAQAGNVDLSTVPKRDTVQLAIYNSEDLTLVRETRHVTFKKGMNPLQFSWANTLIDPTSMELKFQGHDANLELQDTTFPHNKPQMLYWNVKSDMDGDAEIQITYFTSGITWSADYVFIADKDEKQLNIDSFVRVFNHSGEAYENAQIRLVVGTINLVEKIAQLAHISMDDVSKLQLGDRRDLERSAGKLVLSGVHTYSGATTINGGTLKFAKKQIVKEGLSEYFIYTVDGTEIIPDGWSKRVRSFEAAAVPFKVQYR